mmetsp:Transcript_28059/g.46463  ORF Transcript_28059/g.46463 Transcript_28059/m.46463 type:complete len:91 (+) Transcript_28059:422-694(+)
MILTTTYLMFLVVVILVGVRLCYTQQQASDALSFSTRSKSYWWSYSTIHPSAHYQNVLGSCMNQSINQSHPNVCEKSERESGAFPPSQVK